MKIAAASVIANEPVSGDGQIVDERHVFPSAVQIAEAGRRTLEELGLSSLSRSIFLMSLHLSHGPLLLERTADPEVSGLEPVILLDGYRGIGPRVANCVALKSLEKLDALPLAHRSTGPWRPSAT